MKKLNKILIITFVVCLIDQITKVIITNTVGLSSSIEIIKNIFYITNVRNYGAAWSILQNRQIFLIIITLLALVFIFMLIKKEKKINNYKTIYYGVLIGGILGNLIDRVFHGYVIDFIETYIFGYSFPVFNISDTFIVIGVFMIIIEMFFRGEKNE